MALGGFLEKKVLTIGRENEGQNGGVLSVFGSHWFEVSVQDFALVLFMWMFDLIDAFNCAIKLCP